MMLGASKGTKLTVYATGEQKKEALKAIAEILESEEDVSSGAEKKSEEPPMKVKGDMLFIHNMNISAST